jgi:S-adenosylmethionine decarboxylase proenzyme
MSVHHDLPPYQMNVTRRFLILSLIASSCISFLVGQGTRVILVFHYRKTWNQLHKGLGMEAEYIMLHNRKDDNLHLPSPMVKGGKQVPHTVYTSKHFDTSRPVTSASLFIQKEGGGGSSQASTTSTDKPPPPDDVPNTMTSMAIVRNKNNQTHLDSLFSGEKGVVSGDDDEELHLPAGQHLLLDFDNVDATFLNSQKQLAEAMVAMVYECGLTMLSYHCFGLEPTGVSCAGVLLESHVAFHTWPEEGVITMDLFTCGATSLLPMVPMIEQLFARPRHTAAAAPPKMIWSYKRRGFSNLDDSQPNYKKRSSITEEASDTFSYPLGVQGVALKKEVRSHVLVDIQMSFVLLPNLMLIHACCSCRPPPTNQNKNKLTDPNHSQQ